MAVVEPDSFDEQLARSIQDAPDTLIGDWIASLTPGNSAPKVVPTGLQLLSLTADELVDEPFELETPVVAEVLLRCYMLHHHLVPSRKSPLPDGLLSWDANQVVAWLETLGPRQASTLAAGSELATTWTGASLAAATNSMIHVAVKKSGKKYSLADASVLVDRVKAERDSQVKAGTAAPWTSIWTGRTCVQELPEPVLEVVEETHVQVDYSLTSTAPVLILADDAPPPPTIISTKIARADDAFSGLWNEHRILERNQLEMSQYTLTLEERACVPTEFPDVLDLSQTPHVLALIGQSARFGRDEMLSLKDRVATFAAAVAEFKQCGDQLTEHKKVYKQLEDQDGALATANALLDNLREASATVQAQSDELRRVILEMRQDKNGFDRSNVAPSQSEFGANRFPIESARWFTRAVYAFKEVEKREPHWTTKDFVRWVVEEDAVGTCEAATELINYTGTRRPGNGTVDRAFLLEHVGGYMRAFKSSLPSSAWLNAPRTTEAPRRVRGGGDKKDFFAQKM